MNNKRISQVQLWGVVKRCKQGDINAKQELAYLLMPIIKSIIKRSETRFNGRDNCKLNDDELASTAYLCLFKDVIPSYRCRKGKFVTYCYKSMCNAIAGEIIRQQNGQEKKQDLVKYCNQRFIKSDGSNNGMDDIENQPNLMDIIYFKDSSKHQENGYENAEIYFEVERFAKFYPLAAEILWLKFSGIATTVREIAIRLGISKSAVQYELQKAIDYFRKRYSECD